MISITLFFCRFFRSRFFLFIGRSEMTPTFLYLSSFANPWTHTTQLCELVRATPDFEGIHYELITQALLVFEEEVSDTASQHA